MKKGLVLEGGAMRGIYTAGVLDVFLEKGIMVDGIVGVSAGTVHGVSYVSGQYGRSIRYMKKYCRDWRFMSIRSLILTGSLVGTKFSYDDIPYRLDPFDFNKFLNSHIEFYACATNVETGKAEYLTAHDEKRSLDIIRASSSMPLVSKMVEIDGKKYLDGGTSDSIPVKAAMNMGFEKNIVVLTQPDGYVKQPDKSMKLMRKKYRDYPAYIEAAADRHIMYNETIDYIKQLEKEGKAIVIRPSEKVDISRTEKNPEIIQKQYDLGRKDAIAKADEIKKFLLHEQ